VKRGTFRFGAFELDTKRVELRKSGIRVRLQEQPFRILVLLLSANGAVVTRDELRRELWPEDTFVEFNHGLNAAVNKLRETLGDSAANPRFVETIPRRGYRFIAPVDLNQEPRVLPDDQFVRSATTSVRRRAASFVVLAVILAITVPIVVVLARRNQLTGDPVPKPLTTHPGREFTPSFSPDADRVAFAWAGPDERDLDIYIKQIGSEQPHRMTANSEDDVQPAWSPDGRSIAFLRATAEGTAAIMVVPAVAGSERKIGELHTSLPDAIVRRLLTWLPDSRGLIVADKMPADAPRALFRLSVVTGERQQITFPPPLRR
jgi:DNA-binding winged helix-turn-helix (wHTH) protein